MKRLRLLSPLHGRLVMLDTVPDPVFAQRLAGDGVAIEPLDQVLHAPCDGEVVMLAASGHALTLRHAGGAEILMHVGIDTVALHGGGFEPQVRVGEQVVAGAPLLRFDLDRIARRARSACTPVLLAGGGNLCAVARAGLIQVGEFLFELEHDASVSPVAPLAGDEPRRARYRVPFDHGLHARPAALLVAALRGLQAEVSLRAAGRRADARSAVALMSLGLRQGDEIEVEARGADAVAALAALARLLSPPGAVPAPASPGATSAATPVHVERFPAIVAVPGLALGVAVQLHRPEPQVAERGAGEAAETAALHQALAEVEQQLTELQHAASGPTRELLAAHLELLRDPELAHRAAAAMQAGASAAFAWRQAVQAVSEALLASGDPRIAERAADLRDLQQQVLCALRGEAAALLRALPPDAVLFADELLPSQLIRFGAEQVRGICMARGGATAHVTLLAAARGIPTLVGAGPEALGVAEGARVLLDAESGRVAVDPTPAECEAVRQQLERRAEREADDLAAANKAAISRDGVVVSVCANIGAASEAAGAVERGADGCGLLRSEFLFMDRRVAPDEDEQAAVYAAIVRVFGPRTVTLRTLDVGGDKPLAYLPLPREENPALGLRGVRVGRRQPALLRSQLRAALRASAAGSLRIMVPMVNDPDELREVRRMLQACAAELGIGSPPLGAMVETPAAALQAEALLREADFLSIGSNDLAQYTLAIDRGHAELGAALDALHPAVLRLIRATAAAGRVADRRVSLCGGLAADPQALPVLLGLGLRELSVPAARLPGLKRAVRELDLRRCEALAERALAADSAADVRAMLAAARTNLATDANLSFTPAGEDACAE